ncbi:unnamed protein product [Gadus morhua 'NCC']
MAIVVRKSAAKLPVMSVLLILLLCVLPGGGQKKKEAVSLADCSTSETRWKPSSHLWDQGPEQKEALIKTKKYTTISAIPPLVKGLSKSTENVAYESGPLQAFQLTARHFHQYSFCINTSCHST